MDRRDRDLAATAWRLIERIPADARSRFRSRAMGLGPMVVTSGLAATVAFLEAKAGPGAPTDSLKRAYRITSDSLAQHVLGDSTATGGGLLVKVSTLEMTAAHYREASADARVFALWLRRAAEALIERAGAES